MRIEARHVIAALLGIALTIMPLLILSYDPNSKLERLQHPLCRSGMLVNVTDATGAQKLTSPDSGLKMRTTLDGAPVAVKFNIFTRAPGSDWKLQWVLDVPNDHEIYYIANSPPGFQAYVRAIDPTGNVCPQDSPILTAV